MNQETTPIKLDLTPFGALQLLVARIRETHIDGDTPNLNDAMQKADEVIQRETLALMRAAEPVTLSAAQLLEHARDAQDSVVELLLATNKNDQCGGLASLLLLDMIEKATTMQSRIRAILAAVRDGAEDTSELFNVWCAGDGSWMTDDPMVFKFDRSEAGQWSREVAVRLNPSGDFDGGTYRIISVNAPAPTDGGRVL